MSFIAGVSRGAIPKAIRPVRKTSNLTQGIWEHALKTTTCKRRSCHSPYHGDDRFLLVPRVRAELIRRIRRCVLVCFVKKK